MSERRRKERRGQRGGEESERATSAADKGGGGGGQPLLDHHRLIYNAGGSRIHDQNPAFRGIDGSPGAQRAPTTLVFSNEPAPFSSSRCLHAVQRA